MSVYGTLVEDKMRRFNGECGHFSFIKCHMYTHDGASTNFSTNSHETDYIVAGLPVLPHDPPTAHVLLHRFTLRLVSPHGLTAPTPKITVFRMSYYMYVTTQQKRQKAPIMYVQLQKFVRLRILPAWQLAPMV